MFTYANKSTCSVNRAKRWITVGMVLEPEGNVNSEDILGDYDVYTRK